MAKSGKRKSFSKPGKGPTSPKATGSIMKYSAGDTGRAVQPKVNSSHTKKGNP